MALKFAMILEAVDRMSGPGKRALASTRQLTKGARDLGRSAPTAARGMDRMSNSATRMQTRLATSLSRVRALAGRAGMKALETSAYGAGRAIGWTIRKVAGLAVGVAKLAAGSAAFAGAAFFGGVIATTAKFEQFQIMLEGMEGSAAKAKASMDWVQDFAKRTPYELEEVMQAFVQLKAYGIDPLDGSLTSAGDAASGMSKDLMSAVEALADAQTGEFERLKEFAIRAAVNGNRVRLRYVKDGKEMVREVENNATAIKAAVTGIWTERFGGNMDRQSKSFQGLMSNLKGAWSDFLLRVGQAGVFDTVKAKLEGVLKWLDQKLADGSINKWAKKISEQLDNVVKSIGNISEADIDNFVEDVKTVAKATTDMVKNLAMIFSLVNKIDDAWEGVDSWVDKWMIGGPGWSEAFGGKPSKAKAPRTKAPTTPAEQNLWQRALSGPGKSLSAPPVNLRGTMITPGAAKPQSGITAPAPMSGKVVLEVQATPGTSVRTRGMSAKSGDIDVVYRGRANSGFG